MHVPAALEKAPDAEWRERRAYTVSARCRVPAVLLGCSCCPSCSRRRQGCELWGGRCGLPAVAAQALGLSWDGR